MKRYGVFLALLSLLAACGGQPAPTPDLVAWSEQIKLEVFAELTASAPRATRTPEPTQVPTPSLTAPTPTPTLPPTDTATWTPTATATATEPAPTSTATASPVPTRRVTATVVAASPSEAASPAPAVPAASARTGTIAWAAYEPAVGGYTLYMLTADDRLHVIGNHFHQPDISPDGQLIAADGTGGGKGDIWALVIKTGEWRQLTTHLEDHYPNWSANGQKFGFSSSRQGDGVYRLYFDEKAVRADRAVDIIGDYPILLWTGEWVFASCDYGWGTGTRCGTWRVTPGGIPQRLTDNPLDVPTDANTAVVLFLRPEGDNWDIYRVGTSGGAPVPLFASPGRDGPAALSPDGKSVVFLSDRSGSWALYTASLQGGDAQKILDMPAGVNPDRAPHPWWTERISWGPGPMSATATATPVGGPLLPAPAIVFPIPEDTVSTARPTVVKWSWSQLLGPDQGFAVRLWHPSQANPAAVAAPTRDTQLEVWFGLSDAYRQYGDVFYYLDVVVVNLDPYRVVSESAPILVKADPNK